MDMHRVCVSMHEATTIQLYVIIIGKHAQI